MNKKYIQEKIEPEFSLFLEKKLSENLDKTILKKEINQLVINELFCLDINTCDIEYEKIENETFDLSNLYFTYVVSLSTNSISTSSILSKIDSNKISHVDINVLVSIWKNINFIPFLKQTPSKTHPKTIIFAGTKIVRMNTIYYPAMYWDATKWVLVLISRNYYWTINSLPVFAIWKED